MHVAVLQKEVLEYLKPESNENFIDATVGEVGHTLSILERNNPEGKVLGIELDPYLYQGLLERKIDRLILENDSFLNIKEVVKKNKFGSVSGILFDLGFSSWHLEKSKRGFSFLRDEVLDMRYNDNFTELTAEEILNKWPEKEIKEILKEYGEERFAGRISRRITEIRERKLIQRTSQLVEIIARAVPGWYRYRRIHFATRTFQALRIAVNDELNNLQKVLPQSFQVLEKGGRVVVISFHSLEDRIVKNYFKEISKKGLAKILTKKPVRPTEEEIIKNPRSRSAKLRAILKL
jgi:16S rRNA (cytosine1402-N4)-methyltransferase